MTLCVLFPMHAKRASKGANNKISSKLRPMSEIQITVDGVEYNIDIIHSDERRQLVYKCLELITNLDDEAGLTTFEENAIFVDNTYLKWLIENLEKIKNSHFEEE